VAFIASMNCLGSCFGCHTACLLVLLRCHMMSASSWCPVLLFTLQGDDYALLIAGLLDLLHHVVPFPCYSISTL
jgi:hypothetical protein